MIRPWRSLYARIAVVYLLLLVVLCAAAAWIALIQFNRFDQELEQRLNAHLADNLAMAMAPVLRTGATTPAARKLARQIAAINPSLALFVLDAGGRVVAAYNGEACGKGERVSLNPIQALLDTRNPMLPIYGQAPCAGDARIFSVARIELAGRQPGYLYVVLHGRPYQSAKAMLHESVGARAVAGAIVLALVLAGVIGLIWFAFLTRRFGALTKAVQRFKGGDYAGRIPAPKADEIGRLGQAFNEMAATIEAQVEALRRTDRARRDLVANVSHDFRTPLTSLRGYAERLLASGPNTNSREFHRDLTAVIENTDRLTRLADHLSALSRLDAGTDALHIEPFLITELVQDVTLKFTPDATARGVNLQAHCAGNTPPVSADIWLIERVLSNLIDNALRATPSGGSVDVDVAHSGDGVAVTVRDTGCGIQANELPLVTQRFYRTLRSRAEPHAGSGLGLAIVNDILAQHGASLDIKSRVCHGTAARFVLPDWPTSG